MNSVLRKDALRLIKGKIVQLLILFFILTIITEFSSLLLNTFLKPLGIAGSFLGIALGFFIYGLVTMGYVMVSKKVVDEEEITVDDALYGFKNHWQSHALLGFLSQILLLCWALLLIIPGIIKALSYSQAFYIKLDDPSINVHSAIKTSNEYMKGKKMDYFIYLISLFWWVVLLIIFGTIINSLFVPVSMQEITSNIMFPLIVLAAQPYIQPALYLYYQQVKQEYKHEKDVVFA